MLFYAYFSVLKKRNAKRSPIDVPIFVDFLWTKRRPRGKRVGPEESRAVHEGGGRAHPPGRALHSHGPLVAPPTDFFRLYIPIYPKTIRTEDRSGVSPPQASVATKNLSGACSGTLPEGEPITGGHLHHPGALHEEEGVVHPRG